MSVLQTGEIVSGRFRVEAELGAGGFATVFRATTIDGGRPVALKVLRPDDGHGYLRETRLRFDREVAILDKLRSPHTLQLIGHGSTADGLLFLASEYLGGEDLVAVLRRVGRLDEGIVEHILRQLLHSLHEAHNAGIVHRDIKPDNIRILEVDGDPWHAKLLDFGIARPAGVQKSQLTATGELIGTPRYMSPEQLTSKVLTPASDLYSLGMTAFEMLVGSDALQGGSLSDQLQRLQSGYLLPVPGATGGVQTVIQQMCARRPEDRFATAAQVLSVLDGGTDRRPVEAATSTDLRNTAVVLVVAVLCVGMYLLVTLGGDEPRSIDQDTAMLDRIRAAQATPPAAAGPAATTSAPVKAVVDAGGTPEPPALPALTGCREPPPFVGRGLLRMRDEPGRRPWEAYIPRSYDPTTPIPLVILLHGKYDEPGAWLAMSGFPELAEKNQFVVIAPDDTKVLPTQDVWDHTTETGRLYETYDETASRLCIDRARVFVVGHQTGASTLTRRVGCQDWVAAWASNASRMGPLHAACTRRVPTMIVSQLEAPRLPIAGGPNCNGKNKQPLAKIKREWTKWQHCSESRELKLAKGTCELFDCDAPLMWCTTDGGDPWPGLPPQKDFGCVSRAPDFPLAQQIWSFFEQVEPNAPVPIE